MHNQLTLQKLILITPPPPNKQMIVLEMFTACNAHFIESPMLFTFPHSKQMAVLSAYTVEPRLKDTSTSG